MAAWRFQSKVYVGMPIHWFASQGNVDALRLLLRYRNIDPNLIDNVGCTAVYYAWEYCHHECLALLIADDRVDISCIF
jgi:Ankyrin repeats (many copies)